MGVLLGTWDKVGKRLGIVETVGSRLLVGTEVGLCEGTGSVGDRLTVGDTVGGVYKGLSERGVFYFMSL